MNPLLSEDSVREREPLGGIVVSRDDAGLQIRESPTYPDEEIAEELHCLRRRDSPVVDIARDREDGVVVPAEFGEQLIEHDGLILQERRLVKGFPEVQVAGVKQFHGYTVRIKPWSVKGLLRRIAH